MSKVRRIGASLAITFAIIGVVSTPAQSFLTKTESVDEPGKHPYQHSLFPSYNDTECEFNQVCTFAFPTVPDGKRLVVDYASAQFTLTTGGTTPKATLATVLNTNANTVLLPAPIGFGADQYIASGPITFFVDAGNTPTLSVQGTELALGHAYIVTIIGHLVRM